MSASTSLRVASAAAPTKPVSFSRISSFDNFPVVATGEYTQEVRYYVTSLDNTQPEKIASAIRQHWSIENNLHWQLDVTFREDYSKKVKNAARNFSVATKMALIMLKNEKTTKGSMNLKRLKAGWDENYLSQLLRDNNF